MGATGGCDMAPRARPAVGDPRDARAVRGGVGLFERALVVGGDLLGLGPARSVALRFRTQASTGEAAREEA